MEVLRVLTPPEFHSASELIAPIALIPVLLNVYTFLSSGIDSGKNLKPYMIINFVGIIVFGTTLYVMLDEFGVIGAAYAAIFTRIVMIIISHFYSQKRLQVNYNISLIFVLILFGIFSIFINSLWFQEEFFYRIIIALIASVVFPFICIGSISLFKTERIQMLNFVHNIRKRKV